MFVEIAYFMALGIALANCGITISDPMYWVILLMTSMFSIFMKSR